MRKEYNKYLIYKEKTIYYHKLKSGKVKFLCSECGETWYGDLKELKDIQRSHLCPKCFMEISRTTDKVQFYEKFLFDSSMPDMYGNYYGYAIRFQVKNAKKVNIKCRKIFKHDGIRKYIKDYHFNSMCCKFTHDYEWDNRKKCCIEVNTKWHRTKAALWRNYFDIWHDDDMDERVCFVPYESYKDYLMKIPYELDIKSNQMYVIQHNLMNYKQIAGMVAFNLKTIKEVSKYNKYFRNYDIGKMAQGYNLNIYDLDYISKNHISLHTYIDYLDVCKNLGIKDKHPKEFSKRDFELNQIYQEQRDREKNKKLAKKISKITLPTTQFKANNKHYFINYYKSADELLKDSKTFTNCIYSSYTEDYANRKTDLYRCIDDKGKLIACIEICDGDIEQIMGNKNSKPRLYKQIRSALVEMVGA